MSFPVFAAINLAPQLLLEFRYFIVPYLLYRLQVRPRSWARLASEAAAHAAVDAATVALFLWRPFAWDHEPDQVQRFMW